MNIISDSQPHATTLLSEKRVYVHSTVSMKSVAKKKQYNLMSHQ